MSRLLHVLLLPLCFGFASSAFAQPNVLVVRDHLPNGGDAALEFANLGASVSEIPIGALGSTDLSPYCVVYVTAIDQTAGAPALIHLEGAIPQLESYATGGGILFYETGTDVPMLLPAGVTNAPLWDWENIVVTGHPIAVGLPSFLSANCAAFSHGVLENLPANAVPITMTSWTNQVVSASLPFGAGELILTGILGEYGLPSSNCWISLDDPGRLWQAMAGYGLSQCDQTVDADELPVAFQLEQNTPNPFNPATTIRFTLPGTGDATLAVFNLSGQQVMELVEGRLEGGEHAVNFQADDLASGIYVYRLQTEQGTLTRRMTLIK